jgi:hypothetical protein
MMTQGIIRMTHLGYFPPRLQAKTCLTFCQMTPVARFLSMAIDFGSAADGHRSQGRAPHQESHDHRTARRRSHPVHAGGFADGKGRVRLANGLVSTIFRAQGVTVDQAFVLLNDKYDRRDSYVSASRARGDSQICSRGGADLVTEILPLRIVPDQGFFGGTLPQLPHIAKRPRLLTAQRGRRRLRTAAIGKH